MSKLKTNSPKLITAILVTLIPVIIATGCDIRLVQAYHAATPEQQKTIVATLQKQAEERAYYEGIVRAREAIQRHAFLTCVRHHESDRGPWPHINGYTAQNPTSSASGAYQYLRSTWQTVSSRAGHAGYATAASAPWYVQDAVALWHYKNLGPSAWAGSGCY